MNADKWVHPTRFSGEYPDGWAGYTFLQWDPNNKVYHPGDDYNWGVAGDNDLGQEAVATASATVFHVSTSTAGYGNLLILKHTLGYNLKRFIKDKYGIDTDTLYTLYGHLQSISVKVGDEVTVGQVVGKVGKSGTQWAHLHCEIYSLWKDLKNTSYRFYPVGWSKEKVSENYLPAYFFIEASKNLEEVTFLGKTKEYWLQVEADRTDLMTQLANRDKDFLKIKTGLDDQIKSRDNEIKQLKDESAKLVLDHAKALLSEQNKVLDLTGKLGTASDTIQTLKNEKTILLSQQVTNYKSSDLFILWVKSLYTKKGGE